MRLPREPAPACHSFLMVVTHHPRATSHARTVACGETDSLALYIFAIGGAACLAQCREAAYTFAVGG